MYDPMKKYVLSKWTTTFACKTENEPLATPEEAIKRAREFLEQQFPNRKLWLNVDNKIQTSLGVYQEDGTSKVEYPRYVIT